MGDVRPPRRVTPRHQGFFHVDLNPYCRGLIEPQGVVGEIHGGFVSPEIFVG